jgi:3-hydroxybutyryl-CoA dehydrogenase
MSVMSKLQTSARPITVIGGGVLGRRLCLMWCSTGKHVVLYDQDAKQAAAASKFVDENVAAQSKLMNASRGLLSTSTSLQDAVKDSWMVIEAIPEILDIKIKLLGQLDKLVKDDCILATNSSSYRSSQMLDEVEKK